MGMGRVDLGLPAPGWFLRQNAFRRLFPEHALTGCDFRMAFDADRQAAHRTKRSRGITKNGLLPGWVTHAAITFASVFHFGLQRDLSYHSRRWLGSPTTLASHLGCLMPLPFVPPRFSMT